MTKNKLKIILFSDTHGKENEVEFPNEEIDIAIFAGDAGTYKNPFQNIRSVLNFIDWYASIPNIKHKIWIAGNHCTSIESGLVDAKAISEEKGLIYLEDETIEIEGLKIFGSPWTPWFYSWAFNAHRGEDINKHWNLIESNTDIIITHGPPCNFGDLDMCASGQRVGCSDLEKKILEIQPKLFVCGHIHEGYGYVNKKFKSFHNKDVESNLLLVNASVLDENYKVSHNPIIVELDENGFFYVVN